MTPIDSNIKHNSNTTSQHNNNNINTNKLPIYNINPIIISTPSKQNKKIETNTTTSSSSAIKKHSLQQASYHLVNFTDAQLVIQRDKEPHQQQQQQQGKEIENICNNNPLISSLQKEIASNQQQEELLITLNDKMHQNNKNNNKTASSKMNEFLSKNQILQQLQQHNNTYIPHDQSLMSSPSSSSSCSSSFQLNNNKNESLIKNKMKKLINKQTNSIISDPQLIASSKMTSPTLYDSKYKSITTSQNDSNTLIISTNDLDYMMFLPDTPVYTETNLPPRILRKYQKKSVTEKIEPTSMAVEASLSPRTSFNQQNLPNPQTNQSNKKHFNEHDLVDLAKTIQDIYQIDDDVVINDFSSNQNDATKMEKQKKNEVVYNSSKHMAPPPPNTPTFKVTNVVPPPTPSKLAVTNAQSSIFKNEQQQQQQNLDKAFQEFLNNFESTLAVDSTPKQNIVEPLVRKTRFAAATSPKAPPRTKIKYRKSKTCEFKVNKSGNGLLGSDNEGEYDECNEDNKLKYEINADSLESLDNKKQDGNEMKKASSSTNNNNNQTVNVNQKVDDNNKYTFSLNYLNNDKNTFLKFVPLNIDDANNESGELFNSNKKSSNQTVFNDSLEKMSTFDNDSLIIPNSNSSSPPLSVNFTRTYSKRAKWDKTQNNLEFIHFSNTPSKNIELNSKKQQNIVLPMVNREVKTPKQEIKQTQVVSTKKEENLNNLINTYALNTNKPVAAVVATPKLQQQQQQQPSNQQKPEDLIKINENKLKIEMISKKTKSLDIAKQKLVEMKKTMDAKMLTQNNGHTNVNISVVKQTPRSQSSSATSSSNATSTTINARTTPRKIKKRSGERSLTAGLILEHEIKDHSKTEELEFKETFGSGKASGSTTPTRTRKSTANVSVKPLVRPTQQRSTSASSLVKLNDSCSDIVVSSRRRRDSITSNTSSNTNCTISSGVNEYKENKASELRKIANLKNKILIKQLDPIYTRNNPVATEIIEAQSEQSKKRLFAKKNEKFIVDPTCSTSVSIFKNVAIESPGRSVNVEEKPCANSTVKSVKNKSEMNKSKSSCDLMFYDFERTNSTLDLLELLNDCDVPKGDLNQYQQMVMECEKLEKSIKLPSTPTTPLTARKTPTKPINPKEKIINKSNNSSNKVRSHSAPSYARNPVINIIDYDKEMALKNVQ